MIIGHIGVALAASRRWDRLPLAWLIGASFAPDLWRLALAASGLGWQRTNLYSHALPWSAGLALAVAAVAWAARRSASDAPVIGGLVLAHVLFDMISGNKPLWNGMWSGLNVQSFQQLELLIEAAIVIVGWRLVWRRYGTGRSTRWALPAMLIAFQTIVLLGAISQRPYKTRCLAYPMGQCTETSWLTIKWRITPLW